MLLTRDELWAEHLLAQWAAWTLADSLGLGYSSTKKLPPLVDQTLTEDELLQVDRCVAHMREWQRRLTTRYYLAGLHITEPQRRIIYRAVHDLWLEIWVTGWPDWEAEQRLSLGITSLRVVDKPFMAVEPGPEIDPPAKSGRGGARKGAGRKPLVDALNFRALARAILRIRASGGGA